MTSLPALPDLDWALFADFDGTLVEIADRPEAVVVDAALRDTLIRLREGLGGALAVVSGRRIADIDGFLRLEGLAAAGLHGLERREADGVSTAPERSPAIAVLHERLLPLVAAHPGSRLEDKGASLALHWRQAPQFEAVLQSGMQQAAAGLDGLSLVAGKRVLEAKPAGIDKGSAISRFMDAPPFHSRLPIFAGDDVTDEDGFTTVNALGGLTIKIGDGETRASYRASSVSDFHDWLHRAAARYDNGGLFA